MLPLSTTTMRCAQASLSSVRAILGVSSNVMMSGVMASIKGTCLWMRVKDRRRSSVRLTFVKFLVSVNAAPN